MGAGIAKQIKGTFPEVYYTVRKRRIPSEGDVVERLGYTCSNAPHTYMTVKTVQKGDIIFNRSPENVYPTEEECFKAAEDEIERRKMELKKENLYEENG